MDVPAIDSPLSDLEDPCDSAEEALIDPALLQRKLIEQKDAYLRLASDFSNFKKRTLRDSEQQAAAGKEAFIVDLLPVLDNLERALACEKTMSSEQLHEGVEMTCQQLRKLLREHGVESVEDVGKTFDPHRQEALATRHDPAQPDHVVLEVIQRGYTRGDKIFRPARVIVNKLDHLAGADRAG